MPVQSVLGHPIAEVVALQDEDGIPAEKLDRLFDPVHMVQESLIDVGPAVSQRLIEAFGGHLTLKHGRGELGFHVSLPPAQA